MFERASYWVPTDRTDVRMTVSTVGELLRDVRYALAAVLGAAVALLFVVFAQNPNVFVDVVLFSSFPLSTRIEVIWGLLPLVSPAYTLVTTAVVAFVAAIIGINVALMAYMFTAGGGGVKESSGSTVGAVLATFGVGCTACGLPVIGELAIIFGFAGAVGSIGFLPFGGNEFTALAVLVLVLSMYWIVRNINEDEACRIDFDE